MKKQVIFTLLSSALVLASMTGISSAEETEAATEAASEAVTEEEGGSAELSDDIYSFQMLLNGEFYEFPMTYDAFIAKGWSCKDDDTMELAPNMYTWASFEKDGLKTTADVLNLCMNTLPLASSDVVGVSFDSFQLEDAPDTSLVLPGGITYGVSTLDDIVAAYGPASDTYEGSLYTELTYKYDLYQEVKLHVDLETGVLNSVDIRNMDMNKCASASIEVVVSADVPENVANYTAPEALSDDLMDFTVEYAGDLYKLPCPVSVFIANGWTLKDNSQETIEGKGSGWVNLLKDNQELHILAKNYDANAAIAENCFVTTVESSVFGPDLELNLSKGLNRGMTEVELTAALDGMDYEVSESSNFKYFNIYHPDSKLDKYQFVVDTEKDEITTIDVAYQPKTVE